MLRHDLGGDAWLRLLEERDAPELHAVIEANRAELARWLSWAAHQDEAGTLAYIRGARRGLADGHALETAIVVGGRIAGTASLYREGARARRTAEVGYWLDARHRGRGIATRAVAALVTHAFEDWDLHRVELRAAPENARSRALAERLGFVEEGTARQDLHVGGRVLDSVLYGVLRPDWPTAPF